MNKGETASRTTTRKRTPTKQPISSLPLRDLAVAIHEWIDDGDGAGGSARALGTRREVMNKLLWFLRDREHAACGTVELRAFLAHVRHGHEEPGGRWGNPACRKAVRPVYIHKFYRNLRAFFNWSLQQGYVEASPLKEITAPSPKTDQIQPFTEEECRGLFQAAAKSREPRRNAAILCFLLDTGARASEACALTWGDLDLSGRHCNVLGKGNKRRTVHFGAETRKALFNYQRQRPRAEPEEHVFIATRGRGGGGALTVSGLGQLFHRLGKAARINGTRCSPHTCRHTWATRMIASGASVYAVQSLLGHESLDMTKRYCALAQNDVANETRLHSPMDALKKRK